MRQEPARIDKCTMVSASLRAKDYINRMRERVANLMNDPSKEERLAKQECIACFYTCRIGWAAMTERPCGLCGSEEGYGSTATDVLCMECARKHELCKHCGGDIRMRARREWPVKEVG